MLLTPFLALLMPSPVTAALPAVAYVRADPDGVGTGFVIDREKRWLVTCRHLVGDRKSAEVFFPWVRKGELETNREAYLSHRDDLRKLCLLVKAKVLRTSDEWDLALLELDSLPPGTPHLPLADSPLSVGGRVFAVGHRADLNTLWNVSPGCVRQSGKLADGYDWQGALLAKDAPAVLLQLPIEQGDSGGPVVNSRGEVVAVVSGLRRQATLAAIGIRAEAVRQFVRSREPEASASNLDALASGSRLRSVVWLRPTATDTRTAGVVIDVKRRLVLTSSAGVSPFDRVGVAFPLLKDGQVVGERDAYRNPVAVHLAKCWHVGTVLHRDPSRDLALVRLDSLPDGVGAAKLSDADPDVGEAVTAVSHPTGTEFVFAHSSGSVKQRGRFALTRDGRKLPAVVYQLPAQPTSAGGPIFNSAGELVGVQSAKDGPAMVGFAVRVNEVRAFVGEALLASAVTGLSGLWNEVNTLNKFAAWHRLAKGDTVTAVSLYPACVPALLRAGRFDRLLELDPQHHEALARRAEGWLDKGEPKKAAADLQRILDVTPGDAVARRRFAFATATAGDEGKAAAEFVGVMRLDAKQRADVLTDVFTHADSLERKAESRAADWLVLALTAANTVAKDEVITTALRRAAAAKEPKAKLVELRAISR
jgi:S1-C subfamily serine protease